MLLGKAHYCAISLDEVLIYILTSHVQDTLPELYYSSTFELFHLMQPLLFIFYLYLDPSTTVLLQEIPEGWKRKNT